MHFAVTAYNSEILNFNKSKINLQVLRIVTMQ